MQCFDHLSDRSCVEVGYFSVDIVTQVRIGNFSLSNVIRYHSEPSPTPKVHTSTRLFYQKDLANEGQELIVSVICLKKHHTRQL